MKKRVLGFWLITVLFLTACGQDIQTDAQTQPEIQTEAEDGQAGSVSQQAGADAEKGSRILIAYFSRAENIDFDSNVDAVTSASINLDEDGQVIGNLSLIAGYLQEATGGDLFSIQTVQKYPAAYIDTKDQAMVEQKQKTRPELSAHVENIDDYDIIFLGFPTWWGSIPMPVATFLEEYNLAGKTIIPFASHEGSSVASSDAAIKELCPDAVVLQGFAIRGGNVNTQQGKETVEDFVAGLNLKSS